MSSLFGYAVMVTPDTPKQQLSDSVFVSDEFRQKMNAWLLNFFGTVNLVEDGRALINKAAGVIYVNPRMYERLKQADLREGGV